jgi:hypothetical protein
LEQPRVGDGDAVEDPERVVVDVSEAWCRAGVEDCTGAWAEIAAVGCAADGTRPAAGEAATVIATTKPRAARATVARLDHRPRVEPTAWSAEGCGRRSDTVAFRLDL